MLVVRQRVFRERSRDGTLTMDGWMLAWLLLCRGREARANHWHWRSLSMPRSKSDRHRSDWPVMDTVVDMTPVRIAYSTRDGQGWEGRALLRCWDLEIATRRDLRWSLSISTAGHARLPRPRLLCAVAPAAACWAWPTDPEHVFSEGQAPSISVAAFGTRNFPLAAPSEILSGLKGKTGS